MKSCRHTTSPEGNTTRLSLSVDLEPHPMIETLAANLLIMLLGEIAADGIRAGNVAVTIDSYHPIHPWTP
jgi:hypothetical protein